MSPAVAAASGPVKVGRNLDAAKATKNDEFYTEISDIERELDHYRDHFRGKRVFLNCDDPDWSSFWEFFVGHFGEDDLGLKHLVSTHYAKDGKSSYKLEYNGTGEPKRTGLKGDGDFRSPECVKLMHQADIVVTNPPFSLFREFIKQLVGMEKKFLVIGNLNAVFYKEIRPLILSGAVWIGRHTGLDFRTTPRPQDGGELKKMGFSCWFTNLKHNLRNEKLLMGAKYEDDPKAYPTYDNYESAIEVAKVRDIPKDYYGQMGVPISFLTKHNPDQFKIIGFNRDVLTDGACRDFYLNGKLKYARLVIQRKRRKSCK